MTRKTDYALLALTHLAGERDSLVSAREMSERFGVSAPLLMNVLKQLSSAGLIDSVRGAHGGYALAREAGEITLSELIETIEGPVRLAPCIGESGKATGSCGQDVTCPIQAPLTWLHHRLRDFFENITLADLAAAKPSAGAGEP